MFLFINFQKVIQLFAHLSEACCVLNLDGGMERKAKNTVYSTAPWGTQNKRNGCSIQWRQMPPVTWAVSLSERTCDIKERLLMTMTPLHTFNSFPRFPQTHFALLVHYPQSIQQHLPQGLLLPISTPVALAPRFSLEEQTSGSLCFLPPSSSSPAVHWEVLTSLWPSRKCEGGNSS